MNKNIENQTSKYNIRYQRRRRWYKILSCLSAIVVFVTTYALIIPAVTWEKTLICEKNEHIHGSSCYTVNENGETVLTCQKEEHIHGNECFDAPPAADNGFICGIPEHKHDDSCYFADGTLKCTLSEHIHSAECIGQAKILRDETISQCEEIIQNLDTDNVQSVSDAFDSLNELYAPVDNAYFGEQSISETEYNSLCKVVDDYSDTVDALIGGTALGRIKLLADENPSDTPVDFWAEYGKDEYSANDWQIKTGRQGGETYVTGDAEYSIIRDNNIPVLRLKKSILPAGKENEFFICLNVEPIYIRKLTEALAGGDLIVTNNKGKNNDGLPGVINNKLVITDIAKEIQQTNTQLSKLISPNSNNSFSFDSSNSTAYKNGKTIKISKITVYTSKTDATQCVSSNVNLAVCLTTSSGLSFYYTSNKINKVNGYTYKSPELEYNSSNQELVIREPAYSAMLENNFDFFKYMQDLSNVSFDAEEGVPTMSGSTKISTITDYLGDYIKGVKISDVHFEVVTGEAEYDTVNHKINWSLAGVEPYLKDPVVHENSYDYVESLNDGTEDVEYYARVNAYQLIYKLTLDMSKYSDELPESASRTGETAAINTNDRGDNKTSIQYKLAGDDSIIHTAEFTSPTVCGQLYSIQMQKKDSTNGNVGLAGAVFSLTDDSGKPVNVSLLGGDYVYDTSGTAEITSGSDGYINIKGLPTGSYHLKEIRAPAGYSKDGTDEADVTFCRTENTQTSISGIVIKNKEVPSYSLEVLKRSDTNSGASPLAGVQFGLYDGDNLIYTLTTNSSGIAALPDNIVLNCETEYTLVETKPPDNYFPPSDSIRFTVDEAYRLTTDTDAVSGYTDISISNKLLHITVINVQGIAELPATGGTGTVIIYTSGLLLISAAVLMFYCTLKEKRRHGGEH